MMNLFRAETVTAKEDSRAGWAGAVREFVWQHSKELAGGGAGKEKIKEKGGKVETAKEAGKETGAVSNHVASHEEVAARRYRVNWVL